MSLLWAALLLGRLRRRGPIDILHVCQPPDVYFPLSKAMRWLGARVVVDQRDVMPELFAPRYPNAPRVMTPVLRWLERRTQRSADHSIGVNDYLRDRMIDAGGSPDRVSIVRNGPVLSRVDRSAPRSLLAAPRPPGLLDRQDGAPGTGRPRPDGRVRRP